jgi:hypothetical protein
MREQLDEQKAIRKKYVNAINRYNNEITDYIERIGRLFILQNVMPFEVELAENEEARSELFM